MPKMKTVRKSIVYIALSLDGYIAGSNNNMEFLSLGHIEGEDFGYQDFEATVDTMIMGRRTYDWVMGQVEEYPFAHLETYLLTREQKPDSKQPIYYNGDIGTLMIELKSKPGKNIFINGGAEIVTAMMRQELVDEYILFIFPVFLGDGVRLFKSGRPQENLKLIDSQNYKNGIVKLHYIRT